MTKSKNTTKKRKFSLYVLLLKKLRKEMFFWYFITFFSSLFYYQANFGLKNWGYEKTEFPKRLFFGSITINSRPNLLLYVFLCYFVGHLLTSLVCEFLKKYTLELCRTHLRKIILDFSEKGSQKKQKHNKEILSNFSGEAELFSPQFILIPHKIYSAVVNIILSLVFLTNFREIKSFAIYFIIVTSTILAILNIFSYQIQKKINQAWNKYRFQENMAMESYLANKEKSQNVEPLINSNFQKTKRLLKKKVLAYLPNLIIPGLSIIFCLVYVTNFGQNWEIENFVTIGLVAGSVQTIFWKVKDITDNFLESSKIKIHCKPLKSLLIKLKNSDS